MKTSKKIISLLLSAAIIMSAMVITAVSAAAAADGSEVYFDNSVFNWENVYIHAYGTKENAKWPGQLMSATDDGLYKASFTSAYKSESIIFNNGKGIQSLYLSLAAMALKLASYEAEKKDF